MTSPGGSDRPCVVITYPYPLGQVSGGSRMTREIARHLGRLGVDVIVLPISTNGLSRHWPREPGPENELGFEFDEELARDGVEVRRVPMHPIHNYLDGRCVRKVLADLLAERRIDVVLSYWHEAGFLPGFLKARGVHFGFIATWQTYSMLDKWPKRWGKGPVAELRRLWKKWVFVRYIQRPYQLAEVCFATSDHTRRELMQYAHVADERIVVNYLGVDERFLELPLGAAPVPGEPTRILFFGRIVPEKGFLDALEALGQIARAGNRNWHFKLLGDGRHEWAREKATEEGIADLVTTGPPVGDEELGRELQAAHFALMPSHSESFGLSFAEAQAAGVPIVTFAVASLPEVIEDGVTGWLAEFRNIDALAACIERAMEDPDATRAAGEAGRRRVRERFTWGTTARVLHDELTARGMLPATAGSAERGR